MYPKHIELRIHQKNYLFASSWCFNLFRCMTQYWGDFLKPLLQWKSN